MILDKINSPRDLDDLSPNEVKKLAREIRERIIEVVSECGGHLAPNLGTVELTVALLRTFKPPYDKILWDVSHQAYGYKLLTERKEVFETIRQYGGISGFLKRDESVYDAFGAGHASTSLSAALGFAVARDRQKSDYDVVAVIGDGALTGGMAMEGLNQIGYLEEDMLVILNDNKMSIAENVGGMREYLTRLQSNEIYNKIMEDAWSLLEKLPDGMNKRAKTAADKLSKGMKNLIVPNILFEELGFSYYGPIDGHDIEELETILSKLKKIKGAKLLHVITEKGHGYKPASDDPTQFHGVGPFKTGTGELCKKDGPPKYSHVFGEAIINAAGENEDIIAITAAMPKGTGLTGFCKKFPERCFDVGIAEQHAVTFAAGLAAGGLRPVCAIYSTFLQRGFDQVIHDVALQRLPVIFCLDRGGLVGADGPTHHGVFDLSYLRMIPDLVVMAPRDEVELKRMFKTAINYREGPIAMRYPRGQSEGVETPQEITPVKIGEAEILKDGDGPLILAVGPLVYRALEVARNMEDIDAAVVDARFIKPLDKELILELSGDRKKVITIEDNVKAGGFGSAVLELLQENDVKAEVLRIGIPDEFVEHGETEKLFESLGMDKASIRKKIEDFVG